LSRVEALHVPVYSLLTEPLAAAAREVVSAAHTARKVVSLDLSSVRPLMALGRKAAWSLVAGVQADVLFANSAEADALVGRGRHPRLLDLAPLVVVKLGPNGCRVQSRGSVIEVATRRITAADTTGAGDAFDAGFLHALIAGGYSADAVAAPALLRRAALVGHRAAARVLTAPRVELSL
jgi:2-dehydro-3-deoxygluconokinase